MIDLIRRVNAKTWPYTTAALLCLITYSSLYALPEMPMPKHRHIDKIQHAIAYASLALPVALARPRLAWVLAGVFLLWSGVMELVQPSMNRHRDLMDLLANTTGLCLGLFGAAVLRWIAHAWERHGRGTIGGQSAPVATPSPGD